MKEHPVFSIIICLYIVGERFFEDLKKFKNLKYKNFEIILVTEKDTKLSNFSEYKLPIRVVKAIKSPISLGEKRDIGFRTARGKFCAYIDDDAYPNADWLSNALKVFSSNSSIGAVGGPNLTPPEDNFWSKIGGYIYESYFTSGGAQYRFLPKKRRIVSELQGVNLIIRRDILKAIGGFKSHLNSGDDTKVCYSIRNHGYKVVHDPGVLVYHHRRPFPVGHLKQIRNMGTHRGFFVKAYPHTLAPIYFLPTLLTLSFAAGIIGSLFSKTILLFFLPSFGLVFLIAYISVIKRAGILLSFYVAIGIIMTHIFYGIFFIRGLFLREIEK
jgi:GT2 family glycosyltransferase